MIRRPPIPTLFPSPTLFRSLAAGAAAAFDPADPAARKAILASTGGVFAACDFVGSDRSLQFALGALAKGGKVVITGLIGGPLSTPIALFPLRALTIQGTPLRRPAQAPARAAPPPARKNPPAPLA